MLTLAAPDSAIALVRSDGSELTYGELRAERTMVASKLRGAGTVGIAIHDPARFVVAALGAWEAGAAVVPLLHQADELASRTRVRALIDEQLDVHERSGAPLDPRVGLVLFTSGSSGPPKAVLLSREGILANVEAILSYLPVKTFPRTAIVLPLGYSYALVGQVLTTLKAGGTLLLLGDLHYPPLQLEAMARLDADGLSSVSTSLTLLARAAGEGGAKPRLGYVASAGGPLLPSTVAAVRAAFPGARLFNQYGLTEASPRVAAISDAEPEFERGSVGRALPGVNVSIDREGEIVVRGPSVMLGYLDDPAGTARVLSSDGALRTGDAGRIDANGYLYVDGRNDGVVKCGGERVSVDDVAGEIKAWVADAAVIAVADEILGARLVAFVEAGESALPRLRKALREKLSPAKRPTRIVALDSLPRRPSGKIDLAALKALAESKR
ncbi:MAG: class I adenylate-forming enzyme family protein [Myxococcales bacterium]